MYRLVAFAILVVVQHGYPTQGEPLGRLHGVDPRNLPCPVDEDIAPCICNYDADAHAMTLDCSMVSGDADLIKVFQTYFPFTAFSKLSILDNYDVKTLNDGVFGNATFESVDIIDCAVRTVGANVFSLSSKTLNSLNMASNHIAQFPFESLTAFGVLESLNLKHNEITMIPPLKMSKLKDLDLSENPISALPANVFTGIPLIQHIYLDKSNIQELALKLFGSNKDLYDVSFGGSQIRHLLKDTLRISSSPNLHFIELHNNRINNIEANAISGVKDVEILLMNNELVTLTEAVFKPLLTNNNVLRLEGNPLGCGCDIAWLVLDSSLHHLVSDATCYDGEVLINLDSTFYEDFC